MKTPMQELIDEMTYMLTEGERSIYELREKAKSLLEKEKEEECIKNSMEWLKEYRLNLMSLMGQDDYVAGKLDVIKDILDKCNTKERW